MGFAVAALGHVMRETPHTYNTNKFSNQLLTYIQQRVSIVAIEHVYIWARHPVFPMAGVPFLF